MENENCKLKKEISLRNKLSLDTRRSLHWVLKIGNLKKSIEFYTSVFGMKVLRHEEFDDGCEAKCNGDYARPWSKTMIGFGPEKTNFALELTYNYGIIGYERGNDLKYIGLYCTENGINNAKKLNYIVKDISTSSNDYKYSILGPDNVLYKVIIVNKLPLEPFICVALNVTNLNNTFNYWIGQLNMHKLEYIPNKILKCGYGNTVPLEFHSLDKNILLNHGKAQGRIAFTTSIELGAYIINDFISINKSNIIHTSPVTLTTPGKADVQVVILQDPNLYEICFVGEKGFNDLSTTKKGDEIIDWETRKKNGGDKIDGKYSGKKQN